MKKILKWISVAGISLVLLFVLLLFVFYYLIETGEFRRLLVSEVERQTQLKVSVGETEVELGWVMGVSFRDFTLASSEDPHPVIRAPKILARVALLPLMRRRIVFREVHLYQPVFHLSMEHGDHSSLQSLVANLFFQKQGDDQFILDLRQIRIEKGEVTFPYPRFEGRKGSGVAHLREVDVTLKRILSKSEVKIPSKVLGGEPGVEFSANMTLVKDRTTAGLKSKGKIIFPDESIDLRKAWFDLQADVRGLPLEMLRESYSLPLKNLHGAFGFDLGFQGSLAQAVHVKGKVDFTGLKIEAPDLFSDVVAAGEGSLKLEIDRTPQEMRISHLDLQFDDISLAGRGSIRNSGDGEPYLAMELTTPFLPLRAIQKYVPLKALSLAQWENFVGAIDQGELKLTKAEVSGPLSEIRSPFKPGNAGRIRLDVEVRKAGGDFPGDGYLPLRGISGRIVLAKGDLHYKLSEGQYGQSRIEELEGKHKGFLTSQSAVELRAKGEADLGEWKGQLKLPFFSERMAHLASDLGELSGKGRFDITLQKDAASPYRLEGLLALAGGGLRMEHLALTQISGEILFSPKEIRTGQITALLEGSPLIARGYLAEYLSGQGSFDLTVESPGVKAGAVTRLLLPSGSIDDPGIVRGKIRYEGSLAPAESRKLSGSLKLEGVQLSLKPLLQPLREVTGGVEFDERGIEFQGLEGRVVGSRFALSGRWRHSEKPQLTFTFTSPELDLGHLLSQINPEATDFYDRIHAVGKVRIQRGRYEGFEFSDFESDLELKKRVWSLNSFFTRSHGGTVQGSGSIADYPNSLGFSVEPKIQGVPVQGFLGWFDIGTREITGNVNLTGKLESEAATGEELKRNLSGNFQIEIKDGVAKRMRLIVQVLNLMDLSQWFSLRLPDFNKEGIRFRSATGDFKVDKGIYTTENLLVDGEDLSITGAGKFDGPNEVTDFLIAVRPFPGVDSAVSYIPLIGPGLAGIKDSIMVASFHVQGPVDNATITPAPLSTLSEFFFSALKIPQKIITIPGTRKP